MLPTNDPREPSRDARNRSAFGAEFPTLIPATADRRQVDGVDGFVLVDPLAVAAPTFVAAGVASLLLRLDGAHSRHALLRDERHGSRAALTPIELDALLSTLDERLWLEGPRRRHAELAAAANFLDRGARDARHVGSAGWPVQTSELRARLDALVPPATGTRRQTPRGIVAPHIDLQRGADGYAAAYRSLAESEPADLYVVFGTAHRGPQTPVTGLPIDWELPIGVLRTDREFIDSVHATLGAPNARDVLLHRDEHSLEFQMLFLRHLLGNADVQVAGFLTGGLPSADGDPSSEIYVGRILDAFRAATQRSGKRVCFVAGADLAHVGPDFGDAEPVDDRRLARLARDERERLDWLIGGEPGRFHQSIVTPGNPDRICSATSLYLVGTLAGGTAQLLHYGQAVANDGSQAVTFAAVSYSD